MRRVVITGLGALTPIGNTVEDYWKNLIAGVSGAGPITRFDASKFKTRFACELKDFRLEDHIDRKEARRYDLFTSYGIIAAEQAIAQSGANFKELDRNRIGVIFGAGNGGVTSYDREMIDYAQNDLNPRFSPFMIPRMITDICAGVISIKHGLRGINYATVSACATSTTAVINAFNYIQFNKADMIIAGGSEAAITHSALGGFSSAKALSTRNEDYATACRPYDKSRDGFVMGEGAGAIVLESYDHAVARGANIICEVAGGGMAADAFHLTGTHPKGEGGYLAMNLALEEAGIDANQLDYLNAHATSTPGGDGNELVGVKRLFSDNNHLNISATKSMIGHLLGAAGVVEAIACVKACEEDMIPPTINTTEVEKGIDQGFDLTLGQAVSKEVNYAMSNSFGFGGHCASVLVKKFKA